MKALRLGFVCTEYPPAPHGGIGRFVKDLAEALARRGHEIFVLMPGLQQRTQQINGVRIDSFPLRTSLRQPHLALLLGHRKLAGEIRRWAGERQLQLVEMPDWKSPGSFLGKGGLDGVPIVVRCHGSTSAYAAMRGCRVSRIVHKIEKRGLCKADHVIFVSRAIQRATEEVLGPINVPGSVLPNFVSSPFLEPISATKRSGIVFAGRISLAKGVDLLFRELPEIFRQNPSLELHLAGADTNEAPDRTSLLQHLLSTLPTADQQRIKHHGWLPPEELRDLFLHSRCAIFPSAAEAFGLVGIEAMACECPPIVPAGSCFTEFVDHGVNGLHFDRSQPGSLTEQVRNLLNGDESKSSMGTAGRAKVLDHFSEDVLVPRNLELYREIIGRCT